jgi:protein-histidine pros-kinase
VFAVSKFSFDRPHFQPKSLNAYCIAGLIVAMAAALRLALDPGATRLPFVGFFPAVILATFLCGSTAGLLATGLSVAAAWLVIMPAPFSPHSLYLSGVFCVGSLTVVAVVGAMRAATDNVRRLNETLRISDEKFRGLVESAPDAMVIVDEYFDIVLVNARTEALFGYRRADLVGRPLASLLPERARGTCQAQLGAAVTNPPGQAVELHGLRKDGSEFPIEVSLGCLKTAAGTLLSIAIRDITERRKIETRLQEASKAKSDFLASVSHELRTPLNAIIGFSEMIRDAVIGPIDARYREYGSDINRSGRHLQKIINDILDISKIESGRLELRDELVSIGDSVEACRRTLATMAEAAGVALSLDLSGAPPCIRSDEVRFQQILLNLMSNAVKFTPPGGRVRVIATVEADGAVIAVEDTGIGMKPEDIATALEPFRQIEGPMNRRFEGTGLGLPLAKALVELHGGRLEIESAPAAGTRVRIRLPLARMASAAA